MEIIDLTMPIHEDIPVFAGKPKPQLKQLSTIKENGYNEKLISFTSHCSTHVDVPAHMIENGKTLTDIPIEKFIGKAVVIDATKQEDPDLSVVADKDIVFFYTNSSENQEISKTTAQELISKNIKVFGIDSFSPDSEPFEIHKLLLGNEILIVENLVNLDKLLGCKFNCYILPLKIQDGDGCPCRVIAVLEE
jgi:kynurenine formamidase